MTAKIVFTQDIPGEREWLEYRLGSKSLQTRSSGLWKTISNSNNIFEIPPEDDFSDLDIKNNLTYKSVFSNCLGIHDKNWVYSKNLITDLAFSNNPNLETFQVFTFGRSATEFTESILYSKYKKLKPHYTIKNEHQDQKLLELLKIKKPFVVFLYRKNWWDWIISTYVGHNTGMPHFDINWDELLFTLTSEIIDEFEDYAKQTWNYWCNIRVANPDLSCYLLETSEIITKYKDFPSEHKKLSYDKEKIISNYSEMKDIFYNQYYNRWKFFEKNARRHLLKMGCQTELPI